jgi:hypothetical protein
LPFMMAHDLITGKRIDAMRGIPRTGGLPPE